MNLLIQYYEGKIPSLAEEGKEEKKISTLTEDEEVGLLEEVISPKSNLPPLLLKLSERPAEQLDYVGVSYGLTGQLLRYRNGNWEFQCHILRVALSSTVSSSNWDMGMLVCAEGGKPEYPEKNPRIRGPFL